MNIIFVGLSNKINCEPLDSSTKTGVLVDEIIDCLECNCIKANLINFAPIDKNNKLRYPNNAEIEVGFREFEKLLVISDRYVIVGLGDIVCKYLDNKVNNLVKIKHPSYIVTYKKQLKNDYIRESVCEIEKIVKKIG